MASDGHVLDGVRVVELTMWVAGPSACGIMADWGADVVKVEPPTGDPQRNIFGALGYRDDLPNPSFALDNRGKRSIVIDLRSEDGRATMEKLLESADVFVTNMRPAGLERLGLGPEQVAERHPHLVVTTITGYGLDGPEAWRPGYDIGAFWARTGIARDLVPRGAPPIGVRSGMGDHTTGITAVAGTMAALLEKNRTGKGRVVEASLLRTGLSAIGWNVAVQQSFGRLESAKPRERSPMPMVNSYEAGDGKWFWLIALEGDRHFPGLMAAIERDDLASDERFAGAKARKANSEAFIAELDATFASQPLSHWAERFDAHDVWWAPAQTIAEVLDDPQIEAAGGFVEIEDGEGGSVPSVNSPITFRGEPLERTRPVPAIGQHTDEVLSELGLA
jgi:crotonobetainyl-CoA:carnitine CoA-transferase CaiB-like acyl-CoA transferase